MRRSLVALLVTSFFSLTIAPAFADPAGDLNAAIRAFAAAKSVHVDVKTSRGVTGAIDMVQPDKSRTTVSMMGRQTQVVIIGKDEYINMNGSWQKSHYGAANPIITQMNAAQAVLNKNHDIRKEYKVSGGGPAMVNGTPARKYHLVGKDNGSAVDVYIGAGNLPLQIAWGMADENMTWTYSQYNNVPDITPPM